MSFKLDFNSIVIFGVGVVVGSILSGSNALSYAAKKKKSSGSSKSGGSKGGAKGGGADTSSSDTSSAPADTTPAADAAPACDCATMKDVCAAEAAGGASAPAADKPSKKAKAAAFALAYQASERMTIA